MAIEHEAPGVVHRPPLETSSLRTFPWWLVAILLAIAYMVVKIVVDPTYQDAFLTIVSGLGVTIYVTIIAFVAALVIGLLAGLGRISHNIVLRNLAITYIEFVRGVPILVLIFTIAFVVVPGAVSIFGLNNSSVTLTTRAIIALSMIYGAFLAEVFRAGIEAIPRGQMEAARSLGLTNYQAMRLVILPQAIRNVLPALGNDFIAMLKDSSLVSVLGVRDLTQVSRLYASTSFRFTETYFILTFFYLVMTLVLSLLLQWYQRRLRIER
ncbi:amino acid ABC transporter permease [Kallotenue papyrolyticum]|uniref:amino acid ABC transporter permease n=1 Tax=Kallotenue papyrolyticum TaxID=1325125 RepID=UPI0004925969|nr:amino acid ABC transporter permease [Kallotenue papyrolyticum]